MNASVLPRYLAGSRLAILEIAASPMSPVCGVLFVISAGFAREYDGEGLLHEPWHVLRPLAASLVSGSVLFLLIHGISLLRSRGADVRPPRFLTAYRVFMGLFWMTAPMAWLYAIPYERMLSPVAAVEANLWTLALVAGWRVILITRVISVLYGIRPVPAFFIVMVFADAVLFTAMAMAMAPAPVINIMGGIRHSDRDALIAGVTLTLQLNAVLTAPGWIIGALVAMAVIRPTWEGFAAAALPSRGRGLLVVAVTSVVAWAPLLVLSQPEQVNRRRGRTGAHSARVGIIQPAPVVG